MIGVGANGKVVVSPSGESFSYPSNVVKGSNQSVAFDALASVLIIRAQAGFNCTLMAYGQTGSGKTHTMFGPPGCLTESSVTQHGSEGVPEDWGLFPRAVLLLLRQGCVKSLHASAVEVYHENVFDLMDDRAELSIGQQQTKPKGYKVAGPADLGGWGNRAKGIGQSINGVHPPSCTCFGCFKAQEEAKKTKAKARAGRTTHARNAAEKSKISNANSAKGAAAGENSFATVGEKLTPLRNAEEVARFARTIESTRTAKSHLLNDRSSRSHCLVKVHIVHKSETSLVTTLLFVDLAGSERVGRTGVEGEARAEAQAINSSLTSLGRVIKSLGASRKKGATYHVPYRDAVLTMLLRDSFGGKSCTSVVINVAGDANHAGESICSLRFGERMSVVRNSPTVVIDTDARDTRNCQDLLAVARKELAQMTADGLAGGFVASGNNSEKQSLAENMRKLEATEREVRDCITQIAEKRSGGASTTSLEQKLRSSSAQAEVFQAIVGRQQTIKALWALPTPGFKRKAAEVKELEGRVMLELGL